jgi:hypothetical protein
MRITKEIKERLSELLKEGHYYIGGYKWINSEHQDKLLENLHQLDFSLLYPRIICLLHEEGLIDVEDEYSIIKYFLEDRERLRKTNKSEYDIRRTQINSLYGRFTSNKSNHSIVALIYEYCSILYDRLLLQYKDKIVYIDTDRIISIEEINIDDCVIPFERNIIKFGLFRNIKYFVTFDGENFRTISVASKKNNLISEFRLLIRERTLENLDL